MSGLQRKADAHRKIKLGGLVIKSGLADALEESSAALYGLLLEQAERLRDDPDLAKRWARTGGFAFRLEQETAREDRERDGGRLRHHRSQRGTERTAKS